MKFKKELGSDSVQELIRNACARAEAQPRVDIHDPWTDWRRIEREEIDAFMADLERDAK